METTQGTPFIMLGGDLSGIQEYIFRISHSHSKGGAKLFRARSFYLQLLTKVTVLELLTVCAPQPESPLSTTAQIMDAGGRFVLILPNTPAVQDKIQTVNQQLQRVFYHDFKGQLSINLHWDLLTETHLIRTQFQRTLNDFLDQLDSKKLQKFDALIGSQEFSPCIETDYATEAEGNCQLCESHKAVPSKNDEEEDSLRRCFYCDVQIRIIGSKLPKHSHFSLTKNHTSQNRENPNSSQRENLILGWNIEFLKDFDPKQSHPNRGNSKEHQWIYNFLSPEDFSFHPMAGSIPRIEEKDRQFWGTRLMTELSQMDIEEPERLTISIQDAKEFQDDEPKTFNMIAHSRHGIADEYAKPTQDTEDSSIEVTEPGGAKRGKNFLGVFKADVDNLGLIFSTGLGRAQFSVSRFASLSRMLNYFFSVELVKLINEYKIQEKRECDSLSQASQAANDSHGVKTTQNIKDPRDIYVVYSGGDDLFFIGPWVPIVHFGIRLREKFDHFVTQNEDLTLSAGIGVFKQHYPIRSMAPETEQLLDQAKSFENDNQTKNAVTLFGVSVPWGDFPALIQEDGEWWDHQFYKNLLPTALAYRFMSFSEDYQRFMEGDIKASMCLSQMAYYFAKNINREKMDTADYQRLVGYKDKPKTMKHLRIPLFYSLYRNRN